MLSSPLILTPQDSNLAIQSASGERAELCGGRRITGWRQEGSGPVWVASLPDLNHQPWRFRVLIVGGQLSTRARLPESGYFKDLGPDFQVGSRIATSAELTTLNYSAADLGPWLNLQSAEVRVYRVWDESLSKVAWLNDVNHTIGLSTPLRFPPGAYGIHKYEVLNVREGLRAPGQWFLNYATNEVFYWPRSGEDMTTTEVWAPVTEVLLRIEGTNVPVKNITLSNLDFSITDAPPRSSGFSGAGYDGAVSMSDVDTITLSGVRIRRVGASGIQASNTQNMRVLASEFTETGACAISTYNSNDLEIADSRVQLAGHSTPAAAGMVLLGDRMHVHHNEIRGVPYSGISVGGQSPLVEYNHVFNVMQLMSDGAAYYVDGGRAGTIRNNWANDVGVGIASQAPAYYLDEETSGFLIEHNVAMVTNWMLHVHMAISNTVHDNSFISSGDARLTFQGSKATLLTRNVVYAAGQLSYEAAPDAISSQSGSILFSGTHKMELVRVDANFQRTPLDSTGNLIADPVFRDMPRNDLYLMPASPALAIGVSQPLTLSDVGPRTLPTIDAPATPPVLSYTLTPQSLSFGNQLVATTSTPQIARLSNTGTLPITIGKVQLAGTAPGNFNLSTSCPTIVPARSSCDIAITFKPTNANPSLKNAALDVYLTTPAVKLSVALSGAGIVPTFSLSPASLVFPLQKVGTASAAQAVTMRNTGSLPVTMTSISLTGVAPGNFAQSNNCGTTLKVASTCTINVTFKPTNAAPSVKTASLTISAPAPAASQSITLSGAGK
ncbi:choice-of-anchor D domain-containing protein [Paludibaculum fermentans]|uniref:Choice-of-anchor D domain-containing protein n=1 Tax=Paludibaculum fermentans TaxID=1473598 RepID=A0A7S7NMA3_PALFE|nr:choice-of-anchor D domain-containing protein [Paludibaculum fermentans]QOY86253.1 choice-of-anchor D domain-containing protein [Paludibaculum fermentans]